MRRLFTFGPFNSQEQIKNCLKGVLENKEDFLNYMSPCFFMYEKHEVKQWQILHETDRYFTTYFIFVDYELTPRYPEPSND